MALTISVVFGSRNRADLLVGSIKSLDNQEGIDPEDLEFVVVDDGSEDDTTGKVQGLKTRSTLRYYRQEWQGISVARNRAVAEAKNDLIVFVDDDVIAPPRFLSVHRKQFENGRDILVRGPIIIIQEYKPIEGFVPTLVNRDRMAFCGCNASLLRSTFNRLGGFDEDFGEYGYEDNEFGWRLSVSGVKTSFILNAFIFHYKPVVGRETGRDLEEMIKRAESMGRMGWKYFKKHRHWKIHLAVGLHPLTYYYSSLINNRLVAEWAQKTIEKGGTRDNPALHGFLSKRIFQHHYLKSIRKAMKQDR